jgi:hypothetical protein
MNHDGKFLNAAKHADIIIDITINNGFEKGTIRVARARRA